MTKQAIIQLNHICAAYERKKVLEDNTLIPLDMHHNQPHGI